MRIVRFSFSGGLPNRPWMQTPCPLWADPQEEPQGITPRFRSPVERPPPHCGQTNTRENNNLPQTSFASGKN